MSAIREHVRATHAEWLALPILRLDLDAAEREQEMVSEYLRTYFRLPPHAEFEVRVHRFREARRRPWSIFDLVIE